MNIKRVISKKWIGSGIKWTCRAIQFLQNSVSGHGCVMVQARQVLYCPTRDEAVTNHILSLSLTILSLPPPLPLLHLPANTLLHSQYGIGLDEPPETSLLLRKSLFSTDHGIRCCVIGFTSLPQGKGLILSSF